LIDFGTFISRCLTLVSEAPDARHYDGDAADPGIVASGRPQINNPQLTIKRWSTGTQK
jgi:hypothetical protein